MQAGGDPAAALAARSRGAPRLVLLAATRGWCAGVERAVRVVEEALADHGPPIYVRKQIVHNSNVIGRLTQLGAVFVDDERDVPHGARVVFSAHGVSPAVHKRAAERGLLATDAVCPLVTKVHREARRFASDGYDVILIGHAGHEEVEGTMGESPDAITLVECPDDVDRIKVRDESRVAWISQTTLGLDDTSEIIDRLKQRFPAIVGPRTDDICYATTNRQNAVRDLAQRSDLVLVVGSRNSSNSKRLVEVAVTSGADAHLVDGVEDIDETWLLHADVVGVTAGASAPDELVHELVAYLVKLGAQQVEDLRTELEPIHFAMPHAPN